MIESAKQILNKAFICCICGCFIVDEDGNNAEPVDEGRCCDDCNIQFVIPARVAQIMGGKNQDGK